VKSPQPRLRRNRAKPTNTLPGVGVHHQIPFFPLFIKFLPILHHTTMSDQSENIKKRTLEAVHAYRTSKKPNLAKTTRTFEVPIDRLRGRVNGRKPSSAIASHTKALNPMKEKALVS
jgi:hypothetical protein